MPRSFAVVLGISLALTAKAAAVEPLLDRSPIRAPLAVGCAGEGEDSTKPLPPDPRKLVVPPSATGEGGINKPGTAYQYNAYWREIHNAPGFKPNPLQPATTCGEWLKRVRMGREFLETRQTFQLLASARAYDDLWKAWGLKSQPRDFDQQVMQRYGLSAAKFRNPYPLPGEDPNGNPKGGTGQLPLGVIQGQVIQGPERDLRYNGMITISCSACHDSQLGTDEDGLGFHWGRASDAFDASLFGAELFRAEGMNGGFPPPGAVGAGLIPFPYSAGRGINDAFGLIDFLGAFFDMETLDASPGVEIFPAHGAPGQVQTPNWWNRSHRTRMFLGGDLSADNVRSAMALEVANTDRNGAEKKALEPDFENIVAFLESLSPPPYPKEIKESLAEDGAKLFHTNNLWDENRYPANKNRARPQTNGSCAGCHGVYSPYYAADPTILPDPRLKGIVGYITPIGIIGTDPARTRLAAKEFKVAWDTSWWGYDDLNLMWTPSGQGRAGTTVERAINDYSPINTRLSGPNVWEKNIIGYDTPPLYGVWASAPYFHNGSVPTVRGVLKRSERPAVWQRRLTAPTSDGIIQGFDPSFDAYDFDELGWKYTEIPCDGQSAQPIPITCNPGGSPLGTAYGLVSNTLGPYLWPSNQVPAPINETERMRRMIYNTYDYSLGNGGHEFTDVLSDGEIEAIIEYLKTL